MNESRANNPLVSPQTTTRKLGSEVGRLSDLLNTVHEWVQETGGKRLICTRCGYRRLPGDEVRRTCNGLDREKLLHQDWSESEKEIIRRWFGAKSV